MLKLIMYAISTFGLIENACRLDLTGILMLENVTSINFLKLVCILRASKCVLAHVCLTYESNIIYSLDDKYIPIGDLSR